MLQTLISVTRAPVEVRDTEGVSYPLCCQIAGTPPWQVSKAPEASIAGLEEIVDQEPPNLSQRPQWSLPWMWHSMEI